MTDEGRVMAPNERRERCPVAATVDVIAGKWKLLIVFYLLERTRRFGELRRLMPEVTQQMLTLQLRELERDGVVHREVYRQVPPKVEYSLTPLGRSLGPIVALMTEWGERYVAQKDRTDRADPSESSRAAD